MATSTEQSDLLTVAEVAGRLRVSPKTVYDLCGRGLIRTTRVGLGRGRVLISESALAEFRVEAEKRGARGDVSLHHLPPRARRA